MKKPQGDFFEGYDIRPPVRRKRTKRITRMAELDAGFWRFYGDNPEVWRLFLRFTLDVIGRGFEHYSSKSIFERIRWHTDIDTQGADGFKLNNNWTAAYARLFHETYPEHAGFFRLRARASARRPARGEP